MKYKKIDCNTYNIHTIKTDRFKTCTIEIIFKKNIVKDDITKMAFLSDMLTMSNKDYPTKREVVLELERLYNANFRASSSRIGNAHVINFSSNFIDPKFCDEGYLEQLMSFIFGMLTNPNVKNEEFDKRTFNIEKTRLEAEIQSIRESAPRLAIRNSIICMNPLSSSSFSMSGYLDDLERITPSNLYDTYKQFLKEFTCDIYIIGNLDMEEIVGYIKDKFKLDTVKDYNFDIYVPNKTRKKVEKYTEFDDFTQASLVMIYNTPDLTEKERNATIHLYNMVLGAGSLSCKLSKSLREEHSLCYTVNSMYNKYDQLLMIYAGIDKKNIDLSIKLIRKCIKEMASGKFSEEELENNKLQLISSLKVGQDIPGAIINSYYFNNLDNVPFVDERIELIKSITYEEVINVAKKIKENTIYILCDEERK